MLDRTLESTMRLQMLGCAGRVLVLITSLVWVSLWWCSLDLSGDTNPIEGNVKLRRVAGVLFVLSFVIVFYQCFRLIFARR
jgi:hypothetical protein